VVSLREYCKAFLRTRDITDLIPPDTFLTDQTCATSAFSVAAGFRIAQQDDECLSHKEIHEQIENLIAANNLLEPTHRQYQILFRNRNCSIPIRTDETHSPAVQHLEQVRRDHLLQNTSTATLEAFHFLESLPEHGAKAISRFPPKQRRELLRRLALDLDLTARAYTISVPGLDPRRLAKQEMFRLFWRLLNPGKLASDAPELARDTDVANQLRHVSVYWDNRHSCLRVGRRFVRVFTLSEWPDASEPNLFGDMLKINADMTVVTTWQPQERLATHAELVLLRNLKVNIERDPLGTAKRMRDDPTLREILQDAGVQDDLRDIQKLLSEIRRKRHVGAYSMTILLHADDLDELDKPATELDKVFRLPMAKLHEEMAQWAFGNVIPVFASCLPGNGHFVSLRAQPLRNDHHAELSNIWGCDTGHTGEDFAAQYETRLGPIYRMSRKHRMAANRLTIGRTRSGKTLGEIDYIGSLQVQRPLTRIYDASRSYETLTQYFGGSILRCSLGEWNTPVAPFAGNLADPNHQEFCREFVRFLAELNGYQCTHFDVQQISRKLAGLFHPQIEPQFRRLKWLHTTLEGEIKYALEPWVEGRPYGHLFDHATDALAVSDFQLFTFEAVQDGSKHPYLDALLVLLIHRDIQTIMDPTRLTQVKHFTFDEVMSLCKSSPRLAVFLQRILQGMQKYNTSLSIVCQSPEDLGELEPFVKQNCTSFCFYPNEKISDEKLATYGMDEARMKIHRALPPQEFLFHALGGRASGSGEAWKVLKLTVDPYRYWMATTTPEESARRSQVFEAVGPVEGLRQLAAVEGAA
jgi:type IV secretion system protein VirB4